MIIEWPPQYKIKKHRQARHVKLRMSNHHGLEITVPSRFNVKEIPGILEEHKAWIIKQLTQKRSVVADELPTQITFQGMNESWKIYYEQCQTKLEMIERPGKEIILIGNIQDKNDCRDKLLKWVKAQANKQLTYWLSYFSQLTQLSYHRLVVRDQQTLWGSCTFNKSISLNYKLIFLPKPLMDYVMIHELCHTKHMNHSPAFWNLVAKYDPEWKKHRSELRRANQFIPEWVVV